MSEEDLIIEVYCLIDEMFTMQRDAGISQNAEDAHLLPQKPLPLDDPSRATSVS